MYYCRMLDARRLHVLATVVDAGSISGAAAALGYTSSAVSQTISALERETQMALLEKAGRGIRPTQAGVLLAGHGAAVAERLEEAERALRALRSGQAGRLRLAAFSTAGASLVPRAMARFRAGHPSVELDLAVAEDDDALAQLRAGQIDVAVIADDGAPSATPDDLVRHDVLVDPYRVILPRDHRLAGRRTIALGDLEGEAWIATASARCNARSVVIGACADAGFEPRFAIEAEEFAAAVGFVGAGLGVALVPLLAVGTAPDTVRVRPVRGKEPVRHVYALTRRATAGDAAIGAMVEALQTAAIPHAGAAA